MKVKTIGNLLDPTYLDQILGSFSQATGLRIEAVDNRGETLSIPGQQERSTFCQCIRNHPKGKKRCVDSYRRAAAESFKWNEPYFFRCHAGLVIWAVPITHRNLSLGSIICGQVLLWKPDRFFLHELKKSNGDIDILELEKAIPQLTIMSADRSQAAANLLYVVVSHLLKKNLNEMEEEKAYQVLQQQIHSEIMARKKDKKNAHISYDHILKTERRFLQFIRLGDKSRAETTMENLIILIYTKSGGTKRLIKARLSELVSLTSRAAVEGGADAEQVINILNAFDEKLDQIDRVEEYLFVIKEMVSSFLEGIYILADKKHLSLVKNARAYIMEHHAEPLTIADAAAHLFISPSHLSRLFRSELDCTFNDYLTRVRVEKAVELMKKPELSVKQVSQAVGFLNPGYFARIFRKYIGVTPLTYRNSLF